MWVIQLCSLVIQLWESITENITNLKTNYYCTKTLSKDECLILSLGDTFIPTPPCQNNDTLLSHYYAFERNLIKKYLDLKLPSEERHTDPFLDKLEQKINSKFPKPKPHQEGYKLLTLASHPDLQKHITNMRKRFKSILKKHPYIPIPNANYYSQTLQQIAKRTDIIIKTSDKNLGLTAMNRTWYINTGLSDIQLGDKKTYLQIEKQPEPNTLENNLCSILNSHS